MAAAPNPKNANLKAPTREDYEAFDGAHCRTLYQSLADDWCCPGCRRSKFEVLRWTLRFPHSPGRFWGWAGGYHRHHDHSVDDVRYRLAPADGRVERFVETVLCEQCNVADGTAKKKLGLPSSFSFAPDEIRQFVTAVAHGFHAIDYQTAQALYDEAQRSVVAHRNSAIRFW